MVRWCSARVVKSAGAWRILLGSLILAVVVWRIGPSLLVREFLAVPWWVITVALPLGSLLPLCYAWRWQRLLQVSGMSIPFGDALRVTVAASLGNYVLPAFGWVPTKVAVTRQWLGVGLGHSIPTVVLEQAIDLAVVTTFGVTGLLRSGLLLGGIAEVPDLAQRALFLAVVAGMGVSLTLTLFLWSPKRRKAWYWLVQLLSLVWSLRSDWQVWSATVSRWFVEFLLLLLLAWSNRLQLGFAHVLIFLGVPGLIGLVAPVPGGLGVREGTGVSLAYFLGFSPAAVAAVLTWQRLVSVLGLGIAGIVALPTRGRRV